MGFEEFSRSPIESVISFIFIGLVVLSVRQLPSLLAKLIQVIQNNTNIMEMLVKAVDVHDKNVTVELKGQSKKLAVLDQQQQVMSQQQKIINTNVIGIQSDVQEIKSTMVTKQELSQVQDTVSKIYGRSGKF